MNTNVDQYGAEYYAHSCGPEPYRRDDRWLAFFNNVAREIVRSLSPRTVFDAGCALGMLVESLWDLGLEASGVDISEFAISQVRPDMQPYCTIGSVADSLPGRFDLVTCIEVLEHVDESTALKAIDNLTSSTDVILFSSTPNDFVEPTHINVRPPLYWIRAFAKHSFRVDLRFDASFLAPHAMLFRRAQNYAATDVEETYAFLIFTRSALVEREQRIGMLSSNVASLTSDLESLNSRFQPERTDRKLLESNSFARELLTTEVTELKARLRTANAEAQAAKAKIESLESQLSSALTEAKALKMIGVARRTPENDIIRGFIREAPQDAAHFHEIVLRARDVEKRYAALLDEMRAMFDAATERATSL